MQISLKGVKLAMILISGFGQLIKQVFSRSNLFIQSLPENNMGTTLTRGLRANWERFTPSKVQTFGWQLFLHKLPILYLKGEFLVRVGRRIVFGVWVGRLEEEAICFVYVVLQVRFGTIFSSGWVRV